ncbi:PucR family transcriptional regulator [Brevibacillus dissolubilis]|uniref:PucR family transcriptional regulator n=1 Tax=Brevibacillus dissolubilis TaxID=1844116 RepID=UPI001116FB13|nr:helix-turn-helix domain-containing protein [Brevibacillus dissolubilis]
MEIEQKWREEVNRIQQATKLRIELLSCIHNDFTDVRIRYEAAGGEVIRSHAVNGVVWYVGIHTAEWSESARALLPLLLSEARTDAPSAGALTLQEEVLHWLAAVYQGQDAPLPSRLEREWHWTEGRACFVIERTSGVNAVAWKQLFGDFFGDTKRIECWQVADLVYLLLVPLSLLPDESGEPVDLDTTSSPVLLEWAASLHDLLSTEAMENAKVLVAPPLERAHALPAALRQVKGLSHALSHFFPRVMVAATWQYPLERWAATLDLDTVRALRASLPVPSSLQLTEEQLESLESFCEHHLNVSETARSLFLHRNTLLYRLDKIQEQTGLEPRRFADAMLLRLATLLGKLDN